MTSCRFTYRSSAPRITSDSDSSRDCAMASARRQRSSATRTLRKVVPRGMSDRLDARNDRGFADDTIGLDHEWAKTWRIPLVTSPYPRWKYEVALVVPDPADTVDLWRATWPTDLEAEVVGSLIDYRRDWYNERWKRQMLERPLDVDSGTNTLILLKRESGWSYRRATFEGGTWPSALNADHMAKFPPNKIGLIAIIEQAHGGPDRTPRSLTEWMEAHSDVWNTRITSPVEGHDQ
jgi:hypothetical protein